MFNASPTRSHVVRTYEDGDVVVFEGDLDKEMFIIQEGSVRVCKKIGDEEIELATLERGDFFGEMSLLETLPRSATVRAIGRAKLQVVQPGGFLLKIRRDPTFAFEMLQHMSHRIRQLNDHLVEALERGEATPDRINELVRESEYRSGKDKEDEGVAVS